MRKSHHKKDVDPLVKLSKKLSWILRHGATEKGLKMRADGFVLLNDMLSLPEFKGVTYLKIKEVVDTNDKKRFELATEIIEGKDQFLIRAVQGHSIKTLDDELMLDLITNPKEWPIVVHGTMSNVWPLIMGEGLKIMGRKHVHMAIGFPGAKDVISGMRQACDILIQIDMEKAMADGIKFYISKNKVILSSGVNGVLPYKYFQKVIYRKKNGEEEIIFLNGKPVEENLNKTQVNGLVEEEKTGHQSKISIN